jgi:preprotein translocase subunit SecD
MKNWRVLFVTGVALYLALAVGACQWMKKEKTYTLKNPSVLEFKLVQAEGESPEAAKAKMGDGWNEEFMIVETLPRQNQPASFMAVKKTPELTGGDVETVAIGKDEFEGTFLFLDFKAGPNGQSALATVTGQNLGRQLAILVNGVVISAPVIRAKIESRAQIAGGFSDKEVRDLCRQLGCVEKKTR